MKAIDDFLMRHGYPRFEPKAVLFDMDGVLFDSMPFHARAWAKTFQRHGFDFVERDAYLNEGRTGEAVINDYFQRKFGRNATKAESDMLYAEKGQLFEQYGAVKPIADVYALLQHIKQQGLAIFIVTGSAQHSLLDTLNTHFPDIFEKEKMVTAFDVKHGKPDPEPYLMALQKAHAAPWQAVVVENAPLGVLSATRAGIFTVAVNTGPLLAEELAEAGADIVLPSMKNLLNIWPTIYPNR